MGRLRILSYVLAGIDTLGWAFIFFSDLQLLVKFGVVRFWGSQPAPPAFVLGLPFVASVACAGIAVWLARQPRKPAELVAATALTSVLFVFLMYWKAAL